MGQFNFLQYVKNIACITLDKYQPAKEEFLLA